jgi:ElaB/YqjD/DUF883 family membrane-anchored ribosome-binding protein
MADDPKQTEIEELTRQVKELKEKLSSKAQDSFAEMRETVRQNMGDIEKQIREKPVQATLIAAGVGFLIGALITR